MLIMQRRHMIKELHRKGWAISAVFRESGHDRKTVCKVIDVSFERPEPWLHHA